MVTAWWVMGALVHGRCVGSLLSGVGFGFYGASASFVWFVPLPTAFGSSNGSTPFQILSPLSVRCGPPPGGDQLRRGGPSVCVLISVFVK